MRISRNICLGNDRRFYLIDEWEDNENIDQYIYIIFRLYIYEGGPSTDNPCPYNPESNTPRH